MRRDTSPLLQRLEQRHEQSTRKPSATSRLCRFPTRDESNESKVTATMSSSRLFASDRSCTNLSIRFQQDSLSQKLMESKLDCAFRCAMLESSTADLRRIGTQHQNVLANSFVLAEKMSPKSDSRLPVVQLANQPANSHFCVKLNFDSMPKQFGHREHFSTQPTHSNRPSMCLTLVTRHSFAARLDIARSVLLVLLKIKKCHIKKSDLANPTIFPSRSYSITGSERFFRYVVENDLAMVDAMIESEPHLVFQTDTVP